MTESEVLVYMQTVMGDPEGYVRRILNPPNFIHGLYHPAELVLEHFKLYAQMKDGEGLGVELGFDPEKLTWLDQLSWAGSETPPPFDPADPEIVVVLNVTLGTFQQTAAFARQWVLDTMRPEGACNFNLEGLGLMDGQEFVPWKVEWVRIKRDSHLGESPIKVRDPKTSPGLELLFMLAQHQRRAWNPGTNRVMWIPGLRRKVFEKMLGERWSREEGRWLPAERFPSDKEPDQVPYIDVHTRKRQLRWQSNGFGASMYENHTVPTLISAGSSPV